MDTFIMVLQLALSAVLAVAGYGKVRDLAGSQKAVHGFGIAEQFATPLGTVLPFFELALAFLLIPGATARWAAIAAAMLFIAFIAGIGWNLRQGNHPDCHCFGQIHSEPAGWSTILRNCILTLAALSVAWHGGVGLIDWIENLSDVEQVAVVAVLTIVATGALQSWLLIRLLQQNAQLLERIGSLAPVARDEVEAPTSRRAPEFDLPAVDGNRISLQRLTSHGMPVLLVFADPKCGPCGALVPDIIQWQSRFSNELTVAIISRGSVEENVEKFANQGVNLVAMQDDWEVYESYGVRGTPSGVLVQEDGEIIDSFAGGRDDIRDLVSRTISQRHPSSELQTQAPLDPLGNVASNPLTYLHTASGPELGTSSSRLPLPDLNGNYISLEDYNGQEAIILFWSANCSFCHGMLPDLKEWEVEAGNLVERVLVVSAGSTADNKQMGLSSRVILDLGFNLGREFGATGTPSAILLDAEGKVASPLAVGADAVLDLLYERIETPTEPVTS